LRQAYLETVDTGRFQQLVHKRIGVKIKQIQWNATQRCFIAARPYAMRLEKVVNSNVDLIKAVKVVLMRLKVNSALNRESEDFKSPVGRESTSC